MSVDYLVYRWGREHSYSSELVLQEVSQSPAPSTALDFEVGNSACSAWCRGNPGRTLIPSPIRLASCEYGGSRRPAHEPRSLMHEAETFTRKVPRVNR